MTLRESFQSPNDSRGGVTTPLIFDILSPSGESLLPDELKLVLMINPTSFAPSYQKVISRIQTKGGYVEQHWGEGNRTLSLSAVSGGFMRLYTGLIGATSPNAGATRRETLAYDRVLDLLALFQNNGSVYDENGQIVLQGKLKIIFDDQIYYGWMNDFQFEDSADRPYMVNVTTSFTITEQSL